MCRFEPSEVPAPVMTALHKLSTIVEADMDIHRVSPTQDPAPAQMIVWPAFGWYFWSALCVYTLKALYVPNAAFFR